MRVSAAENQSTPPPIRKRDQDIFKCKKMGWGKPEQLPEGSESGFPDPQEERNQTQASSYYLEFAFSKASYLIVRILNDFIECWYKGFFPV